MLSLHNIKKRLRHVPYKPLHINSNRKWEQQNYILSKPITPCFENESFPLNPDLPLQPSSVTLLSETPNVYSCAWNKITNVPDTLKQVLGDSYYICLFVDGFWCAVTSIMDPSIILNTEFERYQAIRDFKLKLRENLDSFYEKKRYGLLEYNKNRMNIYIDLDSCQHESILHYLQDFLELNIYILSKTPSAIQCSFKRIDSSRDNIFLYRDGNSWSGILHIDSKQHIFKTQDVERILNVLGGGSTNSSFSKDTTEWKDLDATETKRSLKKLKIKELQVLCDKYHITIETTDGKRKLKLKSQLQKELYYLFTGIHQDF